MSLSSRARLQFHYSLRLLLAFAFLPWISPVAWAVDGQTLMGRVLVDGTDDGLPGVAVRLVGSSSEVAGRTDLEGRFVFPGLANDSYRLTASVEGFGAVEREVLVNPAADLDLTLSMTATAATFDEIEVTASYSLNRENPIDTKAFSREQLLELPTFGDDLFRAISLVPGTSGNDISSAFTVRGAPYEEVLVRLDGVELFEPFHLKDFSGVLSVVDPQVIGGVEILPGAFPAPYGDRQAGVVDLTTRTPPGTENRAGASLSSVFFSRGQRFGNDDRGASLVSLRRGWLDLVFDLVGTDEGEEEEGAPEYSDFYAKGEWQLDKRTDVGAWVLWADDALDSSEVEDDGTFETSDSTYGNLWLVARGQRLWNDSTVLSGRLFSGRVDRDRRASESLGETDFQLRDERQLDVAGLASELSLDLGRRHLLSGGLEARSYSATYDYAADRAFTDPISAVGDLSTSTTFSRKVDGESYGLWLSDRWRLGERVVAEIGTRYDLQTWIPDNDDQVSPRLNVAIDLGSGSVLRAGWGWAHQSQRPNELQVQDGDDAFYVAERAEHRTLGWDRLFDNGGRLRIDAYQRLTTDVRPRFVNLFSPFVLFPEGTPDRVRLDVDRSEAYGAEVFVQGKRGPRFNWWASYSWSQVEDRVDGEWLPRPIDQTHALTVDFSYRIGRKWNLNAAWIYHTGWPITQISARRIEGDEGFTIEPVIGPLFGERVDDYHRLDMRLSRSFALSNSRLQLFVDVQNFYNRENERGWEFGDDAFQVQADGSVAVVPEVDSWLGVVPSFGVTWTF